MKLIGDVDLELAEHAPEAGERVGVEPLLGEAQHAMRAERAQDLLERAVGERLGQVHALDPRAQCLAGMDPHVHARGSHYVAHDGSTGRGPCGSARRLAPTAPLRGAAHRRAGRVRIVC